METRVGEVIEEVEVVADASGNIGVIEGYITPTNGFYTPAFSQFKDETDHSRYSESYSNLGLSFQKLPYDLYIPSESFGSAPAAFGVYQPSPSATSPQSYNSVEYPRDAAYEFASYPNYDYQYDPHRQESWNQQQQYKHEEKDYGKDEYSMYNTMESDQTVAPIEHHSLERAPRSTGQPTNIVANGKIDRRTLKRMRNRVSASRCRHKKKEWINEMEDESNIILTENGFLQKRISELEGEIAKAKKFLDFVQTSN